jgi:DNA (cytosine-5)-methyltransferase 1
MTPPTEFSEAFVGWVSRLREDYSQRQRSARPRSGNAYSSLRSRKTTGPESQPLFPLDQWPTPTERDHRSIHASPATHAFNSRPLSEAVGLWATPLATDGDKGGPAQQFGTGGRPLTGQVSLWATPTVADTEGGRQARSGERNHELLLGGQAKALLGLPAPSTIPPGGNSSRYGLVLNPWFVERLMGWPTGWTASDFSATALSHWKRRMRSALSRLGSPPSAPVQLDFFE